MIIIFVFSLYSNHSHLFLFHHVRICNIQRLAKRKQRLEAMGIKVTVNRSSIIVSFTTPRAHNRKPVQSKHRRRCWQAHQWSRRQRCLRHRTSRRLSWRRRPLPLHRALLRLLALVCLILLFCFLVVCIDSALFGFWILIFLIFDFWFFSFSKLNRDHKLQEKLEKLKENVWEHN